MRYPVDKRISYDLEVYPNYFLAGFMLPDGTLYQYSFTDQDISQLEGMIQFINWVEQSEYELEGFNSNGYDDVVLSEFFASPGVTHAYNVSSSIISQGRKPWEFTQDIKSIDLMQILPGRMSLKKIGVCLGHKKLQELPFDPTKPLTHEQMGKIVEYNVNDLLITQKLGKHIEKELTLRQDLSSTYGVDLRSKGEATCAELILCEQMRSRTGLTKKKLKDIARANVDANPVFNVHRASWFDRLPVEKYPTLQSVINKAEQIYNRDIHINMYRIEEGALNDTLFLGDRWYKMGVGGLHSIDGPGCWVPGYDEVLMDVDVTSYYPAIMLTQNLSPRHWVVDGVDFFQVTYGTMVDQRIEAKREGNKSVADRLKIVINGTFGKTNDQYSALYDPYIMSSVTVTGQLALLALVAMVSDVGGSVVSANTDGVTLLYKKELDEKIREVVTEWEKLTEFEMEYCEYLGFYQRDVNNYIAIPTEGKLKLKGIFNIPDLGGVDLRHTPNYQIVTRAVSEKIENQKDINLTVTECKDLQEFLLTQQATRAFDVTWKGRDIGNMVRFYKSIDGAEIIKSPSAKSTGNTNLSIMSNSDGAVPLPDLPNSFDSINDLNYDWYIKSADELFDIVATSKIQHMNSVAKFFETQGMMPCLISRGKPDRKTWKSGDVDFCSITEDKQLAICTGRHYGVLGKRYVDGRTKFYKVTRMYPSKSRDLIEKEHGFRLIYGSNIEVAPYSLLYSIDEDQLEAYYTEAELRKAREKQTPF